MKDVLLDGVNGDANVAKLSVYKSRKVSPT